MSRQKEQEDAGMREDGVRSVKVLYSEDAEASVLGCMIMYPDEVIEEVINLDITRRDFFIPANQIVFGVIIDLYEEGMKIDSTTLHQRLEDRGNAKEIGSPGCLATYLVSYSSPLAIGSYFAILKKKTMLRMLEGATSFIRNDIIQNPERALDVLDRAEAKITEVCDSVNVHAEVNFGMEIEEAALSIFEHADTGGGLRGLPTGFKNLDALTNGWIDGDLIIIAARPGKGKTGLMMSHIRTLVEDQFNVETGSHDLPGFPIQMFSLEMRRKELYQRMYAAKARVGLDHIIDGNLQEDDRKRIAWAQQEMCKWPIYIDDTPGMDIALVRSRTRRAKRKYGIRAMFIDYLQLCKSRRYPGNRQNEVADISGQLKQIARENEIPVICLAQLNRKDTEDEDAKPRMVNIRDSGAIEQDADKVILLHAYAPGATKRPTNPGVVHYDAILDKHRNGKRGTVEMDFLSYRVEFTEARTW